MNYFTPIPTKLRNEASTLAKRDHNTAVDLARRINNPWFRAQALAAVARFADDSQVLLFAKEALETAATAEDQYRAIAVAAWPLNAMLERGYKSEATLELIRLFELVPGIEPESSRSEALFNLYQSTYSLGDAVRKQLIDMLFELGNRESAHWRTKRNLRAALDMLANENADYAYLLANQILDEKLRTRVLGTLNLPQRLRPRSY